MIKQIPFETFTLKQLVRLLDEGRYAVPKLQRVFVWTGAKAARLADSMYRGMPVGSLTIWDTPKLNKNLLRVSSTSLPQYNESNARVWFVLDGQQRLSVLYRMSAGGVVTTGNHRQLDFSRVVFRVTDGEGQRRFDYRKPVSGEWVSIPDVLSSSWEAKLKGLTPGQMNRVRGCRDRLLKYKVSFLRAEMRMEDARELFIRINTSGTPLGAADRAFARAAKFDLRELASKAWEKLPISFQGITDEVLLQTRALLDDVHEVGVDAMTQVVERWDKKIQNDPTATKTFTKKWDAQQVAMGRAIDLLQKEFMVLDSGLLPYQNMVATLTTFFCNHAKQPSPNQLSEIRKWFWGTALAQRYSGSGYRQNILGDVDFFKKLSHAGSAAFKLSEPISPAEIRKSTYGKRSSISDAFYCLLISQSPIYLSNGTLMQVSNYASAANRKHKHHIFPRRLLSNLGVGKTTLNTILNLCFIPAEENSQFGSKRPSTYLKQFQNEKHFTKAMGKHLIPYGATSGLWKSNKLGFAKFIQEREKLVCSAFEKAAGSILFKR